MSNKYSDYLQSPEWQNKRGEVLTFWNRRCALCNSDQNVQVHHRTYERMGHEKLTDLIPLCDKCHERHSEYMRHGGEMMTFSEVAQIMIAELEEMG
jgi:5-methylcytosine-specific restriction endonuclease McrA